MTAMALFSNTWLPSHPLSPYIFTHHPVKSQLGAQPLWEGVHDTHRLCNKIYEASTLHKAVVGMQSHEWPRSGSQGACDWLERQGTMAKDAKITVQENGGYVPREFEVIPSPLVPLCM